MSSSMEPSRANGMWNAIAPYAAPPAAAAIAIIPVFPDLIAKSFQQQGKFIPQISYRMGVKEGIKAAPTVGAIVGTQMIAQHVVEKALARDAEEKSISTRFASSAIVGAISAPVLAAFNGQTMGWSIKKSLERLSCRQAFAITMQETAFVAGLSMVDPLAIAMRKQFGENKGVDYVAAFMAGGAGSLVGHPANTVLTRSQAGMTIDAHQLMWGSMRKARAIAIFAVFYKMAKDAVS